jgi:hypothetical protein
LRSVLLVFVVCFNFKQQKAFRVKVLMGSRRSPWSQHR